MDPELEDELRDYQFELSGVKFGIGRAISLDDGGFNPGSTEMANGDNQIPGTDTVRFGRDRASGGPTWGFSLHTDQTWRPETALAEKRRLATAWNADDIRRKVNEVTFLRYRVGGEIRRVYGRPRQFSADPDNRILGGMLPITADFKLVTPLYFGDGERQLNVGLGHEVTGGYLVPFKAPYTAYNPTGNKPPPGALTAGRVGGDMPAPFIAEITGPVTNPYLEGDDWRIEMKISLAEGEVIIVNTYPWVNSVLFAENGGPVPMARKSRLTRARLNSNGIRLRYGGLDSSASSTCVVRWRPAFGDW